MSNLKGDLAPKPNKTPYELRLEILHLAQQIIEREHEHQLAVFMARNEKADAVLDVDFRNSDEEILKIARKLNEFVSNS